MADEVQRALGRIEAKLDSFTDIQKDHKQRLDNHGNRLGSLERWRAWTLGAGAVAGIVISVLWQLLHGK